MHPKKRRMPSVLTVLNLETSIGPCYSAHIALQQHIVFFAAGSSPGSSAPAGAPSGAFSGVPAGAAWGAASGAASGSLSQPSTAGPASGHAGTPCALGGVVTLVRVLHGMIMNKEKCGLRYISNILDIEVCKGFLHGNCALSITPSVAASVCQSAQI